MSIRSAADCQIVRFLVRQDVNRAGVAAYLSAEDSPPHPPPSWGARSREMAAPGGEDETAAHGAIPSPSQRRVRVRPHFFNQVPVSHWQLAASFSDAALPIGPGVQSSRMLCASSRPHLLNPRSLELIEADAVVDVVAVVAAVVGCDAGDPFGSDSCPGAPLDGADIAAAAAAAATAAAPPLGLGRIRLPSDVAAFLH